MTQRFADFFYHYFVFCLLPKSCSGLHGQQAQTTGFQSPAEAVYGTAFEAWPQGYSPKLCPTFAIAYGMALFFQYRVLKASHMRVHPFLS